MVSSKYELLNQIASKVQALDNPIKLKILAMLVEEGSKSVTDISRDMSLNFSTAHKYLEQLEAAGLVTSKQVSENRLKRIFSIGDFNMDISPHGLSNFLNQKKAEPKKTFKVINERGEEVQFDEKIFSQKYIKRGLPARTISNALDRVAEKLYDGITLLELRELFRQEMAKKLETITNVMEMIEESEIRGRTYYNLLKLNHPEALKMHMDGDIFIQNLGEPKLLNFVHDLRGIFIHGVDGKKAKTLSEYFSQILHVVDFVSEFTLGAQSFDSFNYFIAPLADNMSSANIDKELENLFTNLDGRGKEMFVCLELGRPKFIENLLTTHFTEVSHGTSTETYGKYHEPARKIANSAVNLFSKNKYKNLRLLAKLWSKDTLDQLPANAFVANMIDNWQHPTTSFVGATRFDSNWKKYLATNRVGEVQEIVLNLPKIVAETKTLKEFIEQTKQLIDKSCHIHLHLAEQTAAEFLRFRNTTLESTKRERWDYLRIENCQYTISLMGLPETMQLLKTKYKNISLSEVAEQLLKRLSELKRKSDKIRVEPKISRSEPLCGRFAQISKVRLKYDAPLPKEKLAKIQKYFTGGHVEILPKTEAKNLNFNFSLVKIT